MRFMCNSWIRIRIKMEIEARAMLSWMNDKKPSKISINTKYIYLSFPS